MRFRLGCAVWSYKGWVGELYPPGSRPADFLQLYSRRLTAVEGNTTFYAVPDRDTVARWAAETPPGFRFCLKMPRDISHAGQLEPMVTQALAFLEQVRGLGDRLGPLFVQLPPDYGPDSIDDLEAFLRAWPRAEAPLAVEVRHRSWFRAPDAGRMAEMLGELGVGRVILDSRPIYDGKDEPIIRSERQKPRVPVQPVATAPFALVRFISHPLPSINERFVQQWVRQVGRWLEAGIQVYFFVHCPLEEQSPVNARFVQAQLEAGGVPVPPLPWNQLVEPPGQLRLF